MHVVMAEWENQILAVHMLENRHANAWVDRHAVARRDAIQRRVQCEHITVDGELLSYTPTDECEGEPGIFIVPLLLKPEHCYFEVVILDPGESGYITVGLMPGNLPARKQYTWNTDSVAYYSSDGKLRAGSGVGQEFGPPWVAGDVVGCGIKFDKMKHDGLGRTRVQVFFTRNGHKLGTVLANLPADGLRPAIGMCAESPEGAEVRLCLNAIWEKSDVILMSIDNWEEEWARRHDIRLNGQLLEYTGRGKNITDVGLAQARHPLNTTNHYFEIEIIDPGENCYIAIGLARKDYPKHRHPGWNKGSIGYHADDGKIFLGSGVGEPFGPRCHKGETMGCGILFPRDYSAQADCGPTRVCDLCEDLLTKAGEDEDNCHSSESEDEEWWERPYAESGTRVQVFFTRNGKTIGQREIRIAKGGFYPTIGMLSSNEKVRVDLRPLTG